MSETGSVVGSVSVRGATDTETLETMSEKKLWTRAEVARKNHLGDAAIIIDNVVYEITNWFEDHPGGAEVLLDSAGKDASQCFLDVGHSEDAMEWRKRFVIGEVVAEERVAPVSRRSAAARAPPPSLRALLDAAAPPLVLAVIAALVYIYVF